MGSEEAFPVRLLCSSQVELEVGSESGECQAPAPCRRLHYLGGNPGVGGYFLRLKEKTVA